MSTTKKNTIFDIKYTSDVISRTCENLEKEASSIGDGKLIEKIQKVKEASSEVTKHIKERLEQ